jgi:rubredoxin
MDPTGTVHSCRSKNTKYVHASSYHKIFVTILVLRSFAIGTHVTHQAVSLATTPTRETRTKIKTSYLRCQEHHQSRPEIVPGIAIRTLQVFQYINSKLFEMYKLILALLLAASCEAFTLSQRVNTNVGSRYSYTAFRMSEEPTAEVADPMDDAMEEVDGEARKQLEMMQRTQELREQEVFMKKSTGIHKCTNCDWEYDETKGDSMMIGGMIKPGTEFSGLPADWRCPVCRASKDAFQEVVEEIPGFEVNQGYGFGSNAWTSGQKNLAIFGGLAAFFVLFLSGYALS